MAVKLSATRLMTALQPWKEVELPIKRRLAQLADAGPNHEVLWVGSGAGRSVLWWCQRYGNRCEGVDTDASAIERAERAARDAGLAKLATFQVADPASLPHTAGVFDTVIVQMLYLPEVDGAVAIQEAARVTRLSGSVIAVVPSWLEKPDDEGAEAVRALGLEPRLPVEWKGFFRAAELTDLKVEEALPSGGWMSHRFLPLVARGWHAGGWAGARAVASHDVGVVRQLAADRVLNLSIVKGTK